MGRYGKVGPGGIKGNVKICLFFFNKMNFIIYFIYFLSISGLKGDMGEPGPRGPNGDPGAILTFLARQMNSSGRFLRRKSAVILTYLLYQEFRVSAHP